MAQIRLTLDEANGRLPAVCMVCGEPAIVTKRKMMLRHQPWSLRYYYVGIQTPLCETHRWHWLKRTLILLAVMLPCAAVAIGSFHALRIMEEQAGQAKMGPLPCVLPFILLVVFLIFSIVLKNTTVHAIEITESEIVLTKVAQEFVDAVEDQDRDRRSSRRKRRRHDDDDEDAPPPKKQRPPREEFEE